MPTWDVVVVGAGPAGAFAAGRVAERGLAVLLADRAKFPRRKVCGCCLNPTALAILDRAGLGSLPTECGAVPLTAAVLASRGRRALVALSGWVALSRDRFDVALIEAARAAGAHWLAETPVQLGSLTPDGRREVLLAGERSSAGLVLAADGLGGRLIGGEQTVAVGSRVGAGVAVEQADDYEPGRVFMACGQGGYVGLVRLEDGRLNLAAAFDLDFLRHHGKPGAAAAAVLSEAGLPAIPDLADHPWRGTPPLTRKPIRPAAERVLALGDAAGYVEPFTGEGMAWALAMAEAVTPLAACEWSPETAAAWCRWRRRIAQRRLIRTAAWALRRPWVTETAVAVIGRLPGLSSVVAGRLFSPGPPPRPPSPAQIRERRKAAEPQP